MISIKKAKIKDIDDIKSIIDFYVQKNNLLSVTKANIEQNIRDYSVVFYKKKIIGCASLHIYSKYLAEIRSLAIKPSFLSQGIGKSLTKHCIKEAKELGIVKIFALTKSKDFFLKLNFKEIKKESLPEKVFKDCLHCSKFHHCDEMAVLKHL